MNYTLSKKDIEKQIKFARSEIKEWQKFLKLAEKQLLKLKENAKRAF